MGGQFQEFTSRMAGIFQYAWEPGHDKNEWLRRVEFAFLNGEQPTEEQPHCQNKPMTDSEYLAKVWSYPHPLSDQDRSFATDMDRMLKEHGSLTDGQHKKLVMTVNRLYGWSAKFAS